MKSILLTRCLASLIFILLPTWLMVRPASATNIKTRTNLISAFVVAPLQDQQEPQDAVFYYNRSLQLNKTSQYNDAIVALEQAIRLKPDFAEAYNNLGFSYYQIGQYKQAREVVIEAIKLQPNLAIAYSNLGNIYIALGNNTKAITVLEQAAELGLDDEITSCTLGVAYYRSRKYKDAAASFGHAIDRNAQYAVAQYNLGVTYLSLKNKSLALKQESLLKTLAPGLASKLLGGIYHDKIITVTQ